MKRKVSIVLVLVLVFSLISSLNSNSIAEAKGNDEIRGTWIRLDNGKTYTALVFTENNKCLYYNEAYASSYDKVEDNLKVYTYKYDPSTKTLLINDKDEYLCIIEGNGMITSFVAGNKAIFYRA